MNPAVFFLFGIAPSLFWLGIYLRKDRHPEPGRMLVKIFLLGALSTLPAIAIELAGRAAFSLLPDTPLTFALYVVLCIALVEELAKYLVVRWQALPSAEMDEPVDLMEYMIVSALGFAAAENILMLKGLGPESALPSLLALSGVRFLGATLLHALVSGFFGFMLALSFFRPRKRAWYIAAGLGGAVLLHALFNLAIIKGDGAVQVIIPVAILGTLAITLNAAFRKIRGISSVCE